MEKGQSFHSPFFIVRVIKTPYLSRFAVSVPKRVAKTAVLRNKIKKRVYSIVKKMELRVKQGFNTVIIVKVGSEKLPFSDLFIEIEKIFVKMGILK